MALQRAVRCGASFGVGWRAFPTRASEKVGRSTLPDLEEIFDTLNRRALEPQEPRSDDTAGVISAKCAACPSFLAGNCATPKMESGTYVPTSPGAVIGRVSFP
jgi:hypothetical protein